MRPIRIDYTVYLFRTISLQIIFPNRHRVAVKGQQADDDHSRHQRGRWQA
jgi:hypothetical protein